MQSEEEEMSFEDADDDEEEELVVEGSGKVFNKTNVKLGKKLGVGAFGHVYIGYVVYPHGGSTNQVVAVKSISKRRVAKKGLQKQLALEIAVHIGLTHPNILGFYDFSQEGDEVLFYLEYANYGDLLNYVKTYKPGEAEVAKLMSEVGQAIAFCHIYGVVHRDLKPENVLVNEYKIAKLTDFGYCDRVNRDGLCENQLFCGTTDYMSPEMLNDDLCGFPVDVWAFGVMVFDVLVGYPPFEADSRKKTYEYIKRCNVNWKDKHASKRIVNCEAMLSSIFVMPPRKRPVMEQILEDPWFDLAK